MVIGLGPRDRIRPWRLNCAVTALRAFGFVAGAFDLQPPLSQHSIAICLELFQSE